MNDIVKRLEELAAKATPGKWECVIPRLEGRPELTSFIRGPRPDNMAYNVQIAGDDYTGFGDEEQREADNEYIAAANPQAILELTALIKTQVAENKKLRTVIERLASSEALTLPHMPRGSSGKELQARIDFARAAMEDGNG